MHMVITPAEIERSSLGIISRELQSRGISVPKENEAVILRCIHASADFDYAENLRFTMGAVSCGTKALNRGTVIVTDTNMALAGISKPGIRKLGSEVFCYMAEDYIADDAKRKGVTRASAAMDYAAAVHPDAVFAVGNAPTALMRLADLIALGLRPALLVAVPVGFVNVTESKERVFDVCETHGVPCIAAMGRKGGSSIAAAVCNALIYSAAGLMEPEARGWN